MIIAFLVGSQDSVVLFGVLYLGAAVGKLKTSQRLDFTGIKKD